MTSPAPVPVAALLLFTTVLTVAPAVAGAAAVAPGETVRLRSQDFVLPGGRVLAEEAAPFFLVLDAGDAAPPSAMPGTLTSTVFRDSATGTLTFLYAIDFAGQGDDGSGGATLASALSVTGFGSARTDVAGRLAFEDAFPASRSADGDTVTIQSDTPGQGGSPTLLVRTDATDFDAAGVLRFAAADPFLLPSPPDDSGAAGGMTSVVAHGETTLAGVFRPAGAPSAVPLPPAVLTGAGTLVGCGVLRAARRRRPRA